MTAENNQNPAISRQKQIIQSNNIIETIYSIIRSVEKDPIEIAAKQGQSLECSQKVVELQKRLENTRNQIKQLPGIEFSKEDQLEHLESLRNQLVEKQKLINKYKNLKSL